jgi:hypothetical protein
MANSKNEELAEILVKFGIVSNIESALEAIKSADFSAEELEILTSIDESEE